MYQGKFVNKDATPRKKHPTVDQAQLLAQGDDADKKAKPKHSKVGTIIFYSFYGLLILSFIVGMIILMNWLQSWLVEFEASQPDQRSQSIFQAHFASPDWVKLYGMADSCEGRTFDSAEEYAAFMAEHTAGAEITMIKTSAGTSGGKKYIARAILSNGSYLDFATFTLMDRKAEGAVISDWQISEIALYVLVKEVAPKPEAPSYSYTFLIQTGNTVYVDGTPLDDSHIIRTVTTKAEEYLPEGVHGYQTTLLQIDGLTAEPAVVLKDANGAEIPMTYDASTGTYTQDLTLAAAGDTETSAALNAATVYCKYMIRASAAGELKSCFDTGSEIYKTITRTDSWMQGYKSYAFDENQTVANYYRYTDSLFSAKVSMVLNVTRKDGSIKVYDLDTTFFLELQDGKWKVIDMTNVDVQEQSVTVRITYLQTDGTLIHTELLDAASKSLATPAVTASEGQTFRGWATKSIGAEGENVYTVIYQPDDSGTVRLPSDKLLEPTILYAIFTAPEG
ncbi:MAG: hypothetical protein E7466_01240 [Ruminococcaceae bacterium]|nr:hypothetical protein [Oscillospiraceae bacterium]